MNYCFNIIAMLIMLCGVKHVVINISNSRLLTIFCVFLNIHQKIITEYRSPNIFQINKCIFKYINTDILLKKCVDHVKFTYFKLIPCSYQHKKINYTNMSFFLTIYKLFHLKFQSSTVMMILKF